MILDARFRGHDGGKTTIAVSIYRKATLLTRFLGMPPRRTRMTSAQAFCRSSFCDRSVYQAQCGVMTTFSKNRSG
jgi:hypothetical protein